MNYFFVLSFCSFLSLGNLQAINNVNPNFNNAGDNAAPLAEEQWPVQAYQSFEGNFYGSARRSIKAKPCLRSPDQEQDVNQQLSASPNRRAFIAEPLKKEIQFTNFQSSPPQPMRKGQEINFRNPQAPIQNEEFPIVNFRDNSEINPQSEDAAETVRTGQVFLKPLKPQSQNNDEVQFVNFRDNSEVSASSEDLAPKNFRNDVSVPSESRAHYYDSQAITTPLDTAGPSQRALCPNKAPQKYQFSSRRFLIPDNYKQPNSPQNELPANNSTTDLATEKLNVLRTEQANANEKALVVTENQIVETSTNGNVLRSGQLKIIMDNQQTTLNDPARGQGISPIKKNTLMLMDFDRACYACTTANNPYCLEPDRRTSVKYCRKGDDACVTKVYTNGDTETLVRDCGNLRACDYSKHSFPKYKSCSVCANDLCNGAYTITINMQILIFSIIVFITITKPIF